MVGVDACQHALYTRAQLLFGRSLNSRFDWRRTMTPPTFRSNDTQPRKQRLSKGMVVKVGSGLAVVGLVTLIVVTLHLMQGTHSTTTSHSQQTASGPATAAADQTAIPTTTGSATVTVTTVTVTT